MSYDYIGERRRLRIAVSTLETVQTTSSVHKVEFKNLLVEGKDVLPVLFTDFGKVYVTSITRDGCSGCMEQKPLFQGLADKVEREFPGRARFLSVHVQHIDEKNSESPEAKQLFGHTSYPTYMVHVKSQYGVLEHYRAAYPKMEDLEKQVMDAFELADYYGETSEKQA